MAGKGNDEKKQMTPTFEEDRESLVKAIQSKSRRVDRGAETHAAIAEWLANHRYEFDLIKRFGELEKKEGRKVPLCFPVRCNLLKEALRRLSEELAGQPNSTSRASLVMEMLSLQVGRLSMDGYSSVDAYAEDIERRIQKNDFDWKKRHAHDNQITVILCQVLPVWNRLNQPVRNCYCRQCMNRRP